LNAFLAAAAGELWLKKCRPLKWLAWALKRPETGPNRLTIMFCVMTPEEKVSGRQCW